MKPPIQYPGSKERLMWMIRPYIADAWEIASPVEYREPFIGGGASFLDVVEWRLREGDKTVRAWINDSWRGIACLWTALKTQPKNLADLVRWSEAPSRETFEQLKTALHKSTVQPDGNPRTVLEVAFWQVLFSQTGYSGSPYYSEWKAEVWSPHRIADKIEAVGKLLERVELRHGVCTNLDFAEVMRVKGKYLGYCDPPYFFAGRRLYGAHPSPEDHKRFSKRLIAELKSCPHPWVLSYDDASAFPQEDYFQGGQDQPSNMAHPDRIGIRPNRPEFVIVPNRWVSEDWR